MQEVMLFHATTRAEEDVLFNQVCYRLGGVIDGEALHRAWQAVLDAHPALRTAFLWKGLKRPQQIVRSRVELPFAQLDWREYSAAEQERMFEQLRRDDRSQAFDPQRAPLMRITLVMLTGDSGFLVWSSHHLILDRWCIDIVLADVLACYQAQIAGHSHALSSRRSYKNYIAWLSQQDKDAARQFWSQEMAGYSSGVGITCALPASRKTSTAPTISRTQVSGSQFDILKTFCKRSRVTPATLLQGAWALVLNQFCNSQDVVFGVVVSGRPAALPDVESIVGSFVNNLPVRVQMARDQPLSAYVQGIARKLQQSSAYDHVSVNEVQTWAELAPEQTLFDNILVWLTPTAVDAASAGALEFTPLAADLGTAYPLTLSVQENTDSLALSISLNERFQLVGEAAVEELLSTLVSLLLELAALGGDRSLGDISGFKGQLNRDALLALNAPAGASPNPDQVPMAEEDRVQLLAGREQLDQEAFEEYLLTEWRLVLEMDDIPRDADFFALGGDSLKAAHLLARIEMGTRKSIPILSLFQQATIGGMARVVLEEDWPLVPDMASAIRARGELPPLFCIASPEVNIIGYSILSRYLDADRPVYVLQSPPQAAALRRLLPQQIPELASRYIESLQRLQGEGPYRLLGMCSGAQLGIEMVRQLQAQGRTVAFFGVVDTWAFFTISRFYYLKKIMDRFHYYKRRVRELAALEATERAAALRVVVSGKLSGATGPAQSPDVGSGADPTAQELPATPVDEVGWANAGTDVIKIAGTLTLFRLKQHSQQFWRVADRAMGWGKHAEQVQIVPIPGRDRQKTLREPHVRVLARELEICLQGAER
jgi:thioesterase domain-containing protein